MPSLDHKIEEYRYKIEANFKKIFLEIVNYLRVGESNWDGKEITETIQLLEEGKALSFRAMENHFIQHDDLNYTYFKMREKQFEIIERVLPIVTIDLAYRGAGKNDCRLYRRASGSYSFWEYSDHLFEKSFIK